CPLNEITNYVIDMRLMNKNFYQSLNAVVLTDQQSVIGNFQEVLKNQTFSTVNLKIMRSLYSMLVANPVSQRLAVSSLMTKSGYSGRHIEKIFMQHIGLSVKSLHNILRIRSVVNTFHSSHYPSLGQLAYHYGFYDQSHFIKTYKKIMNTVPSGFEETNYILPAIPDCSFFYN